MKHVLQNLVLTLAGMLFIGGTLAAQTPANTNAVKPGALLPKSFSGWEKSASQTAADAAVADPVNAGTIKEYGFTDFEAATYKRDDRQMAIKAARFADASGAYGAFTFYRLPQMLTESFGDRGASLNDRVLFYRGNILVEAKLDRTTAMSAAELRELAAALPLPNGPARNLPTLRNYLPKQAYVKDSEKYVIGPLALAAVGAPISPEQVEFTRGAEVAEGKYSTSGGTATLMLVAYPTPQIAGERLRSFEALSRNPSPAIDSTLAPPLTMKRTGPIVAVVAGKVSPDEAQSLLASVNYDADVTWNENTSFSKKNNVANLLVNIIFLIGVLLGFALVLGLAFGGVRLLIKRLFPGRVFDRPEDMEIIQLKLGAPPRSR
jgi:hypothetical protein